ncbi:ELMO/CED-12 family-domain-containing protein [Schizophyllum commune]
MSAGETSAIPSSSSALAKAPQKTLVPTNTVLTPEGHQVRARIDPTLTVADVVKQLVLNLKLDEPPTNFALRSDMDELVTNDNMRKMIKGKANLKLVKSPKREARDIAHKLSERDDKNLKFSLFSLQKHIKEEDFAHEFINSGGVMYLVETIYATHGNTLAYALTAMQNLMELDYGWDTLDEHFIYKVVQILSSPQSLINVCRPATAILKKFVEADPANTLSAGSTSSPVVIPPGSVDRYGFTIVFEQMRKQRGLLETVISRLGSADTAMALHSMMLINSLLAHAKEDRWEEFVTELEKLNIRKAVVRLMASHTMEDLSSSILDFQANIIRITNRKKMTMVEPGAEPGHAAALKFIWLNSKLEEEKDELGQTLKWRKLGFESEDVTAGFHDVGVLGLECLRSFVQSNPEFSKLVYEQLSRPQERRCPIARASNEVVELLSEHWAIFAPGYSTSTAFQPFFLDFARVHALATQFFIRMWTESGAATDSNASRDDFNRIVALVRSQIKVALRDENTRSWNEVERDFLDSEYRAVRDRQMKELELEDDLLSKVPVRNLKKKLYKESFEFVRQQRIQCLLQGAWFMNGVSVGSSGSKESSRRPARPWRFMRIDNGLRYLHYVDSAVKFPVRAGLEDLPERIDISAISEVATGTCAPPAHLHDGPAPGEASPLSFSLLNAHAGSLADQIAPDASRWADWTDGLNMVRPDAGHVASQETAGFVDALTDIGLKIQLLNLSGEMVDIPSGLSAGQPPRDQDFFFADFA